MPTVREPGFERFGAIPSAAGTLSRHAYARARAAGIDVAPFMATAGVTSQQAEDDNVRITVRGQIRFVQFVADALQDDLLGFHLAESVDLREMGLVYYLPASSESLGSTWVRGHFKRRLASEGLTFAKIREELKLGLAVVYLQEADLPISEIAWLLGYQEVSAFTHAFKRWTGKTPRETRVQKKAARDGKPGRTLTRLSRM